MLLLSALHASPLQGADNPYLYGIHWWGYSGGAIDSTPAALLDCPTYGGWDLETILTHSDPWWGAAHFVPLYQDLYTNKKVSLITRIDYKWGQTVPAPGGADYNAWPSSVVGTVNTLRNYSHIWVIGNEPNITGEGTGWPNGQVTPAGYATIYRNVRNAIHNSAQTSPAGPHIVLIAAPSPGGIIAGVRWMDGNAWLSAVIDNIPANEIDGFAIHSYGWNVSEFHNGYVSQLALIDSKGLYDRPVYITEWNRYTNPANPNDEANTAQFCQSAFADVNTWNQGTGHHNIISMCWFVYDADNQAGNQWNGYAIEYWRNAGIPLGQSGDLYTAFRNAVLQRYPAGVAGTRGPAIERSPASFSRTAYEGQSPSNDTFTIRNAGTLTLNYSITDNASWLSVSPAAGASTGEADSISITYNTASLSAGAYNATVTITDPSASNSPQTIAIDLAIQQHPVPGDFNGDRDVDQEDVLKFIECMTGAGIGSVPSGCTLAPDDQGNLPADFDRDHDVDQADFGRLQRCMTGPGTQGNPNC